MSINILLHGNGARYCPLSFLSLFLTVPLLSFPLLSSRGILLHFCLVSPHHSFYLISYGTKGSHLVQFSSASDCCSAYLHRVGIVDDLYEFVSLSRDSAPKSHPRFGYVSSKANERTELAYAS